MSSRAREYRRLIEEILEDDAALRALGIPGLEDFEIMEIRGMIARVERKMLANIPAK
jgi:hypothetical protein